MALVDSQPPPTLSPTEPKKARHRAPTLAGILTSVGVLVVVGVLLVATGFFDSGGGRPVGSTSAGTTGLAGGGVPTCKFTSTRSDAHFFGQHPTSTRRSAPVDHERECIAL